MRWGYEIFGKTFDEHLQQARIMYVEAKNRLESGEQRVIKIDEPTLEEHFMNGWGKKDGDDQNFYNEITDWNKDTTLREPILIESKDGEKTYVLDSCKMAIGKPEDTFYFHMVQMCAALVMEINSPGGEPIRFAYHVVDHDLQDEGALPAIIQEVSVLGNLKKVAFFYNSYAGNDRAEKHILALKLSDRVQKKIVDMTGVCEWPAHDIYIKGNTSTMYHNEGHYDLETDTPSVLRVKSGEVKIWESNTSVL